MKTGTYVSCFAAQAPVIFGAHDQTLMNHFICIIYQHQKIAQISECRFINNFLFEFTSSFIGIDVEELEETWPVHKI